MKSIHILLVDDSEGDVFLIKDAITESGIAHKVDVMKNGYEASQFLIKSGRYKDEATPDLILLDINMPIMNGYELLDFIKSNDKLKHLPVIMLTTSTSKGDILKSYQKYANCYIAKPGSVNSFDELVSKIEAFWTQVAELPVYTN